MTPHPQAEILRAIADGHEGFEIKINTGWFKTNDPLLQIGRGFEVRIAQPKPKTITGTLTVPEPMREEPEGYFWAISWDGLVEQFKWDGGVSDREALNQGIWRTEAEAIAARDAWQAFLRGGE